MSEWKPIGSRIPSHFDAGRIAGLREAAEMLCKRAEIKREQADHAFEADDEADQHGYSHAAFCLQQEADAILARIAELEQKS